MILRAIDLAQGKKVETLRWLDQLRDWRVWGLPLVQGGLNDQPALLMRQGRYLQYVHDLMFAWQHDKNFQMNQEQSKFFSGLMTLIENRKRDRLARL